MHALNSTAFRHFFRKYVCLLVFEVQPISILLYCHRQAPMSAQSSRIQKLGVGPYTENLLEHLNYLLPSAHSDFLI